MKAIIVNVDGLTIEEKKLINEALSKIKNVNKCNPMRWDEVAVMYGPPSDCADVVFRLDIVDPYPTHTPQQVLKMAGMVEQGHIHAELMAQYAEDAKTHIEPWKLWQLKSIPYDWTDCKLSPSWIPFIEYRRKPKTHVVNGVEIPDLRIKPKNGQWYWFPDASTGELVERTVHNNKSLKHVHRYDNNLCYDDSEEGKQAAILHAKAWLGV